ncbi:DNA methyltransferase [Candidatus Poriferisocius sp.]|uniref:DNA methyltransferase n=1 Tax=Candidatus Poriferisocius sp. TaxID=3101276 RepID=UPI003B01373B
METAPLLDDNTRAPVPFEVEPAPHKLVDATEARTDMTQEPEPRLAWNRQGHTSGEDNLWGFAGTPLYTREKVNPLTMIEQLRKPDAGVPLNLLDDFNGLPPDAQKWEFYQHSGHWQNRLIHGDSSQVMQSLIARDGLGGQVQMIYFDPPYGIGYDSNFMSATDNIEATDIPAGDTVPVKVFRDTYRNGIHSYLDEVHERLVLFRELLADSGSLFVQIGDDNVHRLAVLCDEVFGPDNKVATITWKPTSGSSAKTLPESASYILWYSKDKTYVKYYQLYEPLTRAEKVEFMTSYVKVELPDGVTRKMTKEEKANPDGLLPKGARIYRTMALTSQGG